MTIIEALTLARDKPGTRVRPVWWQKEPYAGENGPPPFITYDAELAVFVLNESDCTDGCCTPYCGNPDLSFPEEFFGDWEEVR